MEKKLIDIYGINSCRNTWLLRKDIKQNQCQKKLKTDYRLGIEKWILVKSIKSMTLKQRNNCDCLQIIPVKLTNGNCELMVDHLLGDRAT